MDKMDSEMSGRALSSHSKRDEETANLVIKQSDFLRRINQDKRNRAKESLNPSQEGNIESSSQEQQNVSQPTPNLTIHRSRSRELDDGIGHSKSCQKPYISSA